MISTLQKTTWKMLWPGKHCFFLLCKVVLAERSSQSVLELLVQSVFVCFGGLLKAGPHRSFGYLRPINILSFSCLVERSCKKVIESFQFQVVFFGTCHKKQMFVRKNVTRVTMDSVTMARGNPTKGVEARPVDCEGVGPTFPRIGFNASWTFMFFDTMLFGWISMMN